MADVNELNKNFVPKRAQSIPLKTVPKELRAEEKKLQTRDAKIEAFLTKFKQTNFGATFSPEGFAQTDISIDTSEDVSGSKKATEDEGGNQTLYRQELWSANFINSGKSKAIIADMMGKFDVLATGVDKNGVKFMTMDDLLLYIEASDGGENFPTLAKLDQTKAKMNSQVGDTKPIDHHWYDAISNWVENLGKYGRGY